MAIKEEFEIRISKDGELKIVAKGFAGKECEIPLKELRKVLEAHDAAIVHSDEYHRVTGKLDAKVKEKK